MRPLLPVLVLLAGAGLLAACQDASRDGSKVSVPFDSGLGGKGDSGGYLPPGRTRSEIDRRIEDLRAPVMPPR